jgi:murein DD-endopeptidase MepM/ murein hydrolase activator NlpD
MAKFSEFMQHSRFAQLLNGQKGSESESQAEVERVGDNASGLEIAHPGITQDEIVAQTGTQELAGSPENSGDDREQVSESVWEDALLARQAHHRPLHRLLPATARIGVLGLVAVAMWWTWPRSDDPNAWFEDARAGDIPSLAVVNPANVEQGGVIARAATLTPDATAQAAQFTNIVIVTPTSVAPGASNTDAVAAVALEEPIVLEASALVTDANTGAIVIEIPGAAPVGELMPALESEPITQEQPATQTEIILIPTATPTPTPQTVSAVDAASVPKVEIVPAVGLRLTPPAEVADVEPIPTETPTATPAPIGPGRLWSTFAPLPPSESDHFWIGNPFEGYSGNRFASPSYQFGSTAGNRYRPHHGLDFSNPSGAPVQAAVEGTIVHAGPDDPDLLGPYANFYGNAVVIRLDRQLPVAGGKLDVFVLYGHLSEVTVEVGQHVEPGDIVGLVGMSGIAIGPHLHVETRLGANTYDHSVNPYLWLAPAEGNGAVAIRLLTAKGRTWAGAKVSIARFENGRAVWGRQIETYLDTENIGPDPLWGENGAMGDVPAGQYILIANINGENIRAEFTVNAGETTFVEIRTEQ